MQHHQALSRSKPLGTAQPAPGSISVCFVNAALRCVRQRQLNADALLQQVGLSPTLLRVPNARVSAKHYGALWRLVALTLDDEFFGQDTRRMKAGSFAMICHAALSCSSLRGAIERSLRFYSILLDDIGGRLTMSAGEARIELSDARQGLGGREFAHEVLLMLLHGVSCWLVGRRIPLLHAKFAYAEPAHAAEYRLMYSQNLEFGAPFTSIAFDAGFLELPIVQDARSVKEFLRVAPESILLKYKNGSGLAARTRRRLRRSLPGELPEFEALAAEMNMTPATLRRRLHEEGASFQSIKDQLRRDLAINYLSHSSRSALEIGLELGFSERSAFHRAFKKWTGASPGEFRRRLLP